MPTALPQKQHTLLLLAAGLLCGLAFFFFPVATGLKYSLAAAAAFLVLYNATWGLYLLAVTLPFLPNLSLLLLAGLLTFSFLLQRLRTEKLQLEPVALEPALLIFLFAITAFTFTSVTPTGSLRDLGIYLLAIALFFVLFNQLRTKNELYLFLFCALLAAFFVSLYGLYQFVIGIPVESAWVDAAQNPELSTRVYSFFGNPNVLAEYLLLSIPFGLALAWSVPDIRKKILFLLMTAALALTLLLTFSRGGWLGLAVGLFLFALLKDKRILLLLLLLALVGIAFAPGVILQRFASIGSIEDSSNVYRFLVWREALLIIRDSWATGVGFGYKAFRDVYPLYMLTRVKTPFHVHNTYLQFLVETGAAGFFIFLWLLFSIFKKGFQSLARCRHDDFLRNIVLAALSSLAGLLAQACVEHVLYMPKITFLFWLHVALLLLCSKLAPESNRPNPEPSSMPGEDVSELPGKA